MPGRRAPCCARVLRINQAPPPSRANSRPCCTSREAGARAAAREERRRQASRVADSLSHDDDPIPCPRPGPRVACRCSGKSPHAASNAAARCCSAPAHTHRTPAVSCPFSAGTDVRSGVVVRESHGGVRRTYVAARHVTRSPEPSLAPALCRCLPVPVQRSPDPGGSSTSRSHPSLARPSLTQTTLTQSSLTAARTSSAWGEDGQAPGHRRGPPPAAARRRRVVAPDRRRRLRYARRRRP